MLLFRLDPRPCLAAADLGLDLLRQSDALLVFGCQRQGLAKPSQGLVDGRLVLKPLQGHGQVVTHGRVVRIDRRCLAENLDTLGVLLPIHQGLAEIAKALDIAGIDRHGAAEMFESLFMPALSVQRDAEIRMGTRQIRVEFQRFHEVLDGLVCAVARGQEYAKAVVIRGVLAF